MNIAKNNLTNKLCAIILIIALTISDFLVLGTTAVTYAIDIVHTNHVNVDFSAYFLNENQEKVKNVEKATNQEEYLYIDISVKNEGYFDGVITLNNNNFNIKSEILSPEIAEISGNTVTLKQIDAGSTVTIKLGVEAIKSATITEKALNANTDVVLKGQYVNSKNVQKSKHIDISGTTKVGMNLISNEQSNVELTSEVLTNSVLKVNEEEKRVVQLLINSKITNNNYPVKNTEIVVSVPENVKEVKVHSRSTSATNSNINFKENNYNYDKKSNKLTIKLSNEDKNNISWKQNSVDTMIVTYVFDKEENTINKEITLADTITLYDNKQITANKSVHIENEIDGIVTYSQTNNETSIYKGKIYTGEEREYVVTNTVNVDYENVLEEIKIEEQTSYLVNDKEAKSNIIYKQTKISKNDFLKIFGEEGYITIKNAEGTTIANINKESSVDENGNITVVYNGAPTSLTITTSKPVSVGTMNLEHTKAILETGYTREQKEMLTGIKEKTSVNGKETNSVIELKETESKADIKLDVAEISTMANSQTLNINATLVTNDESKDLYKEPTITIKLPKEMTIKSAEYATLYKNGLEIKNTTINNNNGSSELKIEFTGEQQKYDTMGGVNIHLKAEVNVNKLTPTKTSNIEMTYTNQNKNVTKTETAQVKFESQYGLMLYNQIVNYNKDEKTIVTVDQKTAYGEIDANSAKKEITLSTALINNYGETISNVELVGKIPAGESEEKITTTLNKIQTNNNNAKIYYSTSSNAQANDNSWTENIANAKSYKIVINEMAKEEVLKLNVSVTIPENLKYNQKGEFTSTVNCNYQGKTQTNSSNIILATKTNITTTEQPIVSTQKTENGITITTTAQVGNNSLSANDSVYEGETIKYTVKIENNTGKDYSNVKVNAEQTNGNVWGWVEKEEYNPFYDKNVKVKYYEPTDLNALALGTIEKFENGKSYTVEYEALTYLLSNEKINGTETYGTISIVSEDQELKNTETTVKNKIKNAELQVKVLDKYYSTVNVISGEIVKAILEIKNITNETLKNVETQVAFSNNLNEKVSIEDGSKISIKDKADSKEGAKIIVLGISELEPGETIEVYLCPATDYTFEGDKTQVWMLAKAITSSGNSYISNKMTRTVYDNTRNIEVNQNAMYEDGKAIDITKDKLNDGDIVKFEGTIVNKENEKLKIDIDYALDKSLDIQSATIKDEKGETNVSDNISANHVSKKEMEIEPSKEIKVIVFAKVNALEIDSITNELSVKELESGKHKYKEFRINVNKVNDIIYEIPQEDDEIIVEEPVEEDIDEKNPSEEEPSKEDPSEENPSEENPSEEDPSEKDPSEENPSEKDPSEKDPSKEDPSEETKIEHQISGKAWIDSNKNGIRNSEENMVNNLKVVAMNSDTNAVIATTTTNENGEYTFKLPEGNYILIFYYDDNVYTTTTYQVRGAKETENSDAIEREVTTDGKLQKAGTTDILKLTKNLENIDIGLINKNTFDLSISKYVSKITVKNDAGTKVYDQGQGTSLAKAEIKSKYLSGSLAVIEYKIKVTNVGDVEGYAKSVVDYMPSSLTFSSELNSDWYLSGKNLYNTSLANTKIAPGETKELTLVLTKTMTESNTGLINNKAEINESSSLLGIEDETKDTGSANVIISVSTGALINYIATTVITLGVLAGLAYIVNKKYFNEGI